MEGCNYAVQEAAATCVNKPDLRAESDAVEVRQGMV